MATAAVASVTTPPRLGLTLLGEFQLVIDAQPVRFARRKCASLLAYLALHPGPRTREQVAQALWPDASADAARGSLRVTLTELRKVLGEAALDAGDGSTLALRPDAFGAGVDTLQFQAALAQGEAGAPADGLAALALYRGDLLARSDEPWLAAPRERLRADVRRLLHRLVLQHRSAGEYARASAMARRALQLDSTDETAHQHLMACLWAQGEREAALHQYTVCEQALAQQLGHSPSAETQALAQDLRRQAARAGTARLSNLPQPATSFVGREDELNAIEERLTRTRLLTLFGPGGSGKTRLAIQAASEVAYGYDAGVWWVDLSTLDDGQRVLKALADVLGVKEAADAPLSTQLVRHIGVQRMLVVLDNCEQVLDACVRLVELILRECPALTVLATSRQSFQLPAEVVWETPTLALPDPADLAAEKGPQDLLNNDALRLFAERAHQADATFQLGPHNAALAASICRRLQGIPLALELAAAQLGSFTLDQLEQRLDAALDFADQGRAAGRHATVRSTIRWSCRGLAEAEQVLFRRVSVFAGGFTAETAAEVATGSASAQGPWSPVTPPVGGPSPLPLDGLTITRHLLDSLVRRALLQVRRGPHGPRYGMLDSLRDDARQQCLAAGEMAAVQHAHHAQGLALARSIEARIDGPEQLQLLDLLERESANLEAAMDWAEQQPDIDPALQLAVALCPWWKRRSRFAWGLRRLRPLLERLSADEGMDLAARADQGRAFYWLGDFACRLNLLPEAVGAARRSLEIHEALDDKPGQARAAAALSMSAGMSGDFETAYAAGLRSLALFRELDDLHGLTVAANRLGELTRVQGLYDESVQHNRESMALAERAGDPRGAHVALLNLGLLAVAQGRPGEGVPMLQRAGDGLQAFGERHQWPYIFQGVGQACQAVGRLADAARLYGALQAYSAATGLDLLGSDLQQHRQALALLVTDDAPADIRSAWQAGLALDPEAGLALVRACRLDPGVTAL